MWYQFVLLLFWLLPLVVSLCSNPGNLPDGPNPPSIGKTLPTGTWIIPMDEKQLTPGGDFNLMVYGYIMRILWADIKLDWIIKSCKGTQDPDFTASVRQVLPVWNQNTPIGDFNKEFRYGAFAILHPHLAVLPYQNLVKLPNVVPPAVYVLNEPVTVEVRHTWAMKPLLGVLSEDDKAAIHTDILLASGLIEDYHFFSLGVEAQKLLNQSSCYTFVSNPHDDLSIKPERAANIRTFCKAGGNFLAQCHGVRTYGMYANKFGEPLLITGTNAGQSVSSLEECTVSIRKFENNENLCPSISDGDKTLGKGTIGTTLHPDTPYMQFDQSKGFQYSEGGSWVDGDIESIRSHIDNKTTYWDLADESNFKAMAGQIVGYEKGNIGGNIYYLAGHAYDSSCTVGDCAMSGRRMYMNAAIVPAVDRAEGCGLDIITRIICDYSVCQEWTIKVKEGEKRPEDETTKEIKYCSDGMPPRTCDWDKECGTLPSCLTETNVRNKGLSCMPNYCGTCQPIWMDRRSSSSNIKFFCDGQTEAPEGYRGSASPSKSPTKSPPTKSPTFSPLKAGETRSPTREKNCYY